MCGAPITPLHIAPEVVAWNVPVPGSPWNVPLPPVPRSIARRALRQIVSARRARVLPLTCREEVRHCRFAVRAFHHLHISIDSALVDVLRPPHPDHLALGTHGGLLRVDFGRRCIRRNRRKLLIMHCAMVERAATGLARVLQFARLEEGHHSRLAVRANHLLHPAVLDRPLSPMLWASDPDCLALVARDGLFFAACRRSRL